MDDLLALLQAGDVDGFARARDGKRVKLFAEELAELALEGVDLSHAELDKSDLTETNLTDAQLVGASMNDIDGTGLILDGAIALGIRLRDAFLEDADLTGADLSRGDLSGAVLHRTRGEGLRLLSAKLKDIEAHDVSWPLADLSEAQLKGADLTGADLSRSRWVDAAAAQATLDRADLTGADAAGVKLQGASLKGAILRAARLPGAQLATADLSGADLRDADLSGANLTGAILRGADLRGAVLVDATLDGADLTDAALDGVDLGGVDVSALALAGGQLAAVARHGAVYDPDAALTFDDVDVVYVPGAVVAVWRNEEDDGSTMRWARVVKGGTPEGGVLAVRGDKVLAVSALSQGGVAHLHVLTERAEGATMLVWRVGPTGPARGPFATPLGYEPAVRPVLRPGPDGAVRVFGLARQGPTLVVHEDKGGDAPMTAIEGRAMQTARGFVGRRDPVILGKGGVVQTLEGAVPLKPTAVPDGFPSQPCDAIALSSGRQDRVPLAGRASEVLAVWAAPARLRDPGGVRAQFLGPDGGEVERVGLVPDVLDIEARAAEGGAWVAWIEQDGPDERAVCAARVPGGTVRDVVGGQEPWVSLRLLDGADGAPWVAVRSLLGRVEVRGLDGTLHAVFGQGVRFGAP